VFRAFRQVLEYAVAMGLLERNPTARIKNGRVAVDVRREQRPFDSWEEVEAITEEMDPRFAAIPIVLVGTGLRPEELFALSSAATSTSTPVCSPWSASTRTDA
jgi:integrase